MATTVELYLGGAWTDITAYVRQDPGIEMTVGVRNEGGTSDPASCTFVVNNRDGRFSIRNTAGAYYGNIKRNTPVRVKVGTTQRFIGEIAEFPSRWGQSGDPVWAPLVGTGILRRYQHASSLDSTLITALQKLSDANGDITGYWPVEDAPGATSVASGLTGGQAGGITGSPVFGAVDLGVSTGLVATWAASTATFFPFAATSTAFTGGCYVNLPAAGALTGGEELFRVECNGSATSWRILYSPGSGGGVFVQVLDQTGTEVLASSTINGLDGLTFYLKLECANSGANVAWALSTLDAGSTVSGSLLTQSVGAPTAAKIGKGTIAIPANADVAIGHVVLGSSDTALFHNAFDDGRAGYAGESVDARMARLASTYTETITVTSGATSPAEMGPQPEGTLIDVLRAAEKADAGGILYDKLDSNGGLSYITRTARYNDQRAQLVLDYSLKQIVPPLEPTDDDQQIRNDVTVHRTDGSSARQVLTSGAISTQDFPNGVGPYPFDDTYAIWKDTQLPYLAGWILGLGTIDETRFPAVTVDVIAQSALLTSIEAVRPGYRLRITNLPAFAGATNVDLQVIGWTERITKATRTITFVCTPGTPWFVFELDDTVFGTLDDNRLAY